MELFKVESCRSLAGCPRAVADTYQLSKIMERIFQETEFSKKRKAQLGEKVKQHHIFKACLAGCANGCSQPQIKDFSLIAKVLPKFQTELCTLCGRCCTACKENGLQIKDDLLIFSEDKCLGCGDCWRACPTQAVIKGEEKWRLLVGGKLGRHPQLAQEAALISAREGIEYLVKAVTLVLRSDNPHQRFADLLKDTTLESL